MDPDKKSAWLRKLDEECPYQVVLPRRQLADDSEILNFLIRYVGKFDMLLNHITVTATSRFSPARLRGHVELPLLSIGFEGHEALTLAFLADFASKTAPAESGP